MDGEKDVFVARDDLKNWNTAHKEPSLEAGEEVEFQIRRYGDRQKAFNVTGPQGARLRGSRYAPRQNRRRQTPKQRQISKPSSSPRETPTITCPAVPPGVRSNPRLPATRRRSQQPTEQRADQLCALPRQPEEPDEFGPLPFQEEETFSGNKSPLTSGGRDQRKRASPSLSV